MHDLQATIEQVLDYLKGIWFKKRYVIITSWLICPIGFFYVATLPDVYESNARVYVDTRSMLQPLLRGVAIQTDPRQEVIMMAKTLLSRENVENIARETDLDISAQTPEAYDALIDSLTQGIKLRRAGRDNLYTISYKNKDPQMARTVVRETLELFVEGTLGSTRQDTYSATRFLDEQISEYEGRLSASEQRLADFKRRYSDILPAQGSFYANFSRLRNELSNVELLIEETQQQIDTLEGRQSSRSNVDEFSVRQSGEQQVSIVTRYDGRIKGLEEKIDQLRLKYTELHPDVIETANLLESLKKARQAELDEYFNASAENGELDLSSGLGAELAIEISRLEGQLASLEVRRENFQEKIETLREKIDLVPQIEAELTALNRDYGITKKKYEELLSRKESALISQKADVSSEDLQFREIVPPSLPNKPSGPARLVMYSAVLIAGFFSGIALAFALSQLNPVLFRAHQLTTFTNFPVLGTVSDLHQTARTRKNRLRFLLFSLSSGIILALYAVLMAAEVAQIDLIAKVMS